MAEELNIEELIADKQGEGEFPPPQDVFPVPGKFVDIIPLPATIYTEDSSAKVGPGGAWGYCPFGVFVTDAKDAKSEETFDGLIPYRTITGIQFHYDEYKAWLDENSGD